MSSPRYSIRNSSPRSRPSGIAGLVKIAVVVAMMGGAGWMLFQNTVHSKLAGAVSEKLSAFLRPIGPTSQIRDARFTEGIGLTLDNVELELTTDSQLSAPQKSRLSVAQLKIHSAATLTDLVSGNLDPQAIELKRAKLQIVRDSNGQFDLASAIAQLATMPRPANQKFAPVMLRDSEIQFVDLSGSVPSLQLSNVNFSLSKKVHNGDDLIHVQGQFQTAAISQITISVYVNLNTQTWSTQLAADNATISRQIIDKLPPDLANLFAGPENLAGSLSFSATAQGNNRFDTEPTFEVTGNLSGFSVDDKRLPVPIRNCAASFLINNEYMAIQNATGQLAGQSTFDVSYVQSGLLQRNAWRCTGAVSNFNFDNRRRIRSWLPEFCDKFCSDFSPYGTSDISFDFTHDGQKFSRTLIGSLTDMSFSFVKMPYQVDHCSGQVKIVDSRCDFSVQSQIENQPVGLFGFADNIGTGSGPTYQVNIKVPGDVRIDEKLLAAADAQPKLAKVVRAFNPTGRVGGSGVIERQVPLGPVNKKFDLHLSGCTVRHNSFDYPIYNVRGDVSVENSQYKFKNIQGNNSTGLVKCNGTWDVVQGLNLFFNCRAVPLNDQLRLALKPEIREIWDGFRPRGTLDQLDVLMTMPIGATEVQLDVEATLPETNNTNTGYVSIFPIWFPYTIDHLTGKIRVGHGRIRLTNMSGSHRSTTMACHGEGNYSDASWSLRLKNLLVNSLKVDNDLLAAVPKSMASPLAQLRFTGLANVNGQITLAGSKQSNDFVPPDSTKRGVQLASHNSPVNDARPSRSSMAWDVRVNMNQASMMVGLQLNNVFGGVQLSGIYDGETVVCDGQLDLDSMTIFENQVTSVTGPFRIENHRVSAGTLVDRVSPNATRFDTLASRPRSAPASSISGILHKGIVRLDAEMDTTAKNEFYVQTTLADACLSTACQELAPDFKDVDGHSFAKFQITGDNSGTHSHRGNGNIILRDARIYELPVFISLLKILNVRQLTRTAFDSGDIEFQIIGERIVFDRMQFTGDAISLIGNGEMNLDRDIDLNFYSVMGRNQIDIPLLSKLYRAGSQRTLAIKVDGKLDNPQTHRQVLPELNDNLKRLFNRGSKTPPGFGSPLPARPSRTNQPINLGESYFQTANDKELQFPGGLRR